MLLRALLSCGVILGGCSVDKPDEGQLETASQSLTGQEQNVADVFGRHVNAFFSGNLDAVLNDFSESSIVMTAAGVFQGKDQIRAYYAGLLAEFGTINNGDSPGIFVDLSEIRNDMLYITWHAESKHLIFSFGTDTFIVDGSSHFARQSISFVAAPK